MNQTEFKELHEAWNEFQVAHGMVESAEKKGAAVDPLITERLTRIEKALEEAEGRANRRGGFAGEPASHAATESKKMFLDALRGKDIPQEELKAKALISGNDVQGGFLVPLEMSNEIITEATEYSPVRSIATVRTTSRMGVQIPRRTTAPSAAWISETGTRTESSGPTFGMSELRTFEMHGLVKISRAELEDAAFDLEAFLRAEFAERFGVLEGASFISGSGDGQPSGILTSSSVLEVPGGHASQLTGDGMIELLYGVKDLYAANGVFVLNRSTLKTLRQLKSGSGEYLWAPGLRDGGRPPTILDQRYIVATDMPSIGSDAYPVLFGDFRRGYMILDRVQIEVLIDPYKSKETGMVEFSARKRVGGQVILGEAICKLKIATS